MTAGAAQHPLHPKAHLGQISKTTKRQPAPPASVSFWREGEDREKTGVAPSVFLVCALHSQKELSKK